MENRFALLPALPPIKFTVSRSKRAPGARTAIYQAAKRDAAEMEAAATELLNRDKRDE